MSESANSSNHGADSPHRREPKHTSADGDNDKWFEYHQQALQQQENVRRSAKNVSGSRIKSQSSAAGGVTAPPDTSVEYGLTPAEMQANRRQSGSAVGRPQSNRQSWAPPRQSEAPQFTGASPSYMHARNSILSRRKSAASNTITHRRPLTGGEQYMLAVIEERELRRAEAQERAAAHAQEREAVILDQEVAKEYRTVERLRDVEEARRQKVREARKTRQARMAEARERRDQADQLRVARVEAQWKQREQRLGAAPSDPYAVIAAKLMYQTPQQRKTLQLEAPQNQHVDPQECGEEEPQEEHYEEDGVANGEAHHEEEEEGEVEDVNDYEQQAEEGEVRDVEGDQGEAAEEEYAGEEEEQHDEEVENGAPEEGEEGEEHHEDADEEVEEVRDL